MIKKITAMALALTMACGSLLSIPKAEAAQLGWKNFDMGHNAAIAVRSNGTMWGWGNIGDSKPRQLSADTDWLQVSVGFNSYLALKSDHTLWGSGENTSGELGVGDLVKRSTMTQIGTDRWKVARIGNMSSLGIKADGTLWAWGNGQSSKVTKRVSPVQIAPGNDWVDVHVNTTTAIALKTDGTVWTWGQSISTDQSLWDEPKRVDTAVRFVSITGNKGNFAGITDDGALWTWGLNVVGNLGLGDQISRTSPTQVGTSKDWKKVQAGESFMAGLKKDGTLWTWGKNENFGLLGTGSSSGVLMNLSPVNITNPAVSWVDIDVGTFGTLATDSTGVMYAWGRTYAGATGTDSANLGVYLPTKINSIFSDPILTLSSPSQETYDLTDSPKTATINLSVRDPESSSHLKVYYTVASVNDMNKVLAQELTTPSSSDQPVTFDIHLSKDVFKDGRYSVTVWAENDGASSTPLTITLNTIVSNGSSPGGGNGTETDIVLYPGLNKRAGGQVGLLVDKHTKVEANALQVDGYAKAVIKW